MAAKIKFVPHSLNEEEETYHAVIEHTETLTQEDILDEMEWHSSTLTKTDMLACFESHDRAIVRALLADLAGTDRPEMNFPGYITAPN